jgi:hypothetical protein
MCGSLQNFFMLLGLDFMPLDQSVDMSMNGLRRQVAIHDKTQTETWMDESLVALDLGHQVSASGSHQLSFHLKIKSGPGWTNRWLHWIQGTRFQLVGPSAIILLLG